MLGKKYENRFFILLLSSVINDTPPPLISRRVDWEYLYRLCDYHKVGNVIYYAMMGQEYEMPDMWREKFYLRYKEALGNQKNIKEEVYYLYHYSNNCKIHCILLEDAFISEFYPKKEMRLVQSLGLLAEKGEFETLKENLKQIFYEEVKSNHMDGTRLRREGCLDIVIYENLPFKTFRMRWAFRGLIKYSVARNGKYFHEFDQDDCFVYLISNIVTKYASGQLQVRDILDLWVFYREKEEQLEWRYIIGQLKKIGIYHMSYHIIKLCHIWFLGETTEEDSIYNGMETYILSRGAKAPKISKQMLPKKLKSLKLV